MSKIIFELVLVPNNSQTSNKRTQAMSQGYTRKGYQGY